MSLPTSLLAYADCIEAFDKCLEAASGMIRLKMPDYGAANFFRMRLHNARSLDRRRNREIYSAQPDHPMFGCSPYDPITAKVRHTDDSWWVYLKKISIDGIVIEEVTELPPSERQLAIADTPRLQITVQRSDGAALEGEVLPPIRRRV